MPATTPILSNPFLTPLRRSYVGAVAICGHTAAILDAQRSNPSIAPINALLAGANNSLAAAFAAWLTAGGLQKGKTLSLTNLLATLSKPTIGDWDLAIQQVHRKDSPRYLEILPRGRNPFQEGRQAQKIAEVAALIDRIGSEAALGELKTEIQAFHTSLTAAEAAQEGAIGATESSATALQAAVTAAAVALFKVYGALIALFAENPEAIGDYFNMELILDREQRAFTGTVAIGATKHIVQRTLEVSAQIRFVNNGPVPLRFYFAPEKNDAPPATGGLLLSPGEDETVAVGTLGSGHFLNVTNESEEGTGSFQLIML